MNDNSLVLRKEAQKVVVCCWQEQETYLVHCQPSLPLQPNQDPLRDETWRGNFPCRLIVLEELATKLSIDYKSTFKSPRAESQQCKMVNTGKPTPTIAHRRCASLGFEKPPAPRTSNEANSSSKSSWRRLRFWQNTLGQGSRWAERHEVPEIQASDACNRAFLPCKIQHIKTHSFTHTCVVGQMYTYLLLGFS